ncbi:hypothetical protein [Demequina sp.]|uniref:hypothetical protein n=1 Tax=Demequina sp. TaxID=2050685 RepID=UPI003D0AA39B
MAKPESVVVYDGLALTSGSSHGLGRVSSREALSRWEHFLSACTTVHSRSSHFTFPQTPSLTVDPAVRARIASAFPEDAAWHRHPVPADRFEEALDLLTSIEPQPKNQWGMSPVWLWHTADFSVLGPSGNVWPGQDSAAFDFETPGGVRLGSSRSALILEGRRSMSVSLNFPRATDDELSTIIPWLQANLPFTLSTKHWTRWTLAKNGTTYRGRKIQL